MYVWIKVRVKCAKGFHIKVVASFYSKQRKSCDFEPDDCARNQTGKLTIVHVRVFKFVSVQVCVCLCVQVCLHQRFSRQAVEDQQLRAGRLRVRVHVRVNLHVFVVMCPRS